MSLAESLALLPLVGNDTVAVAVPGLLPDAPTVVCSVGGAACVAALGMGFANAGASAACLLFARLLDLRTATVIIGGMAGVAPAVGTLGSPAWHAAVVDLSLQMEVDSREAPAGWPVSEGWGSDHCVAGCENGARA